jgi:hypothetical protein
MASFEPNFEPNFATCGPRISFVLLLKFGKKMTENLKKIQKIVQKVNKKN